MPKAKESTIWTKPVYGVQHFLDEVLRRDGYQFTIREHASGFVVAMYRRGRGIVVERSFERAEKARRWIEKLAAHLRAGRAA